MLPHYGDTNRRGEKAFAPAATPGRMMPRGNAPIAPQQAWQSPANQFTGNAGVGIGITNFLFFLGTVSLDVLRYY